MRISDWSSDVCSSDLRLQHLWRAISCAARQPDLQRACHRAMKDALPSSAEIEALREENRKLRKINAALIDRVERSSDMAGNAFSMFATAISLEAMVRERTAPWARQAARSVGRECVSTVRSRW